MNSKYSLQSVKKLFRDLSLVTDAIQLLREDTFNAFLSINRHWYKYRYGFSNFDPLTAEWDNFIIIDAARPDLLRSAVDNAEDIRTIESPVSYSGGFMRKVLNGKELHDTVYITANPHTEPDLESDVFHDVVNLLDSDWDEELETVRPEVIVSRAFEARETYPKKRLMIHFMQPHFPFIGREGEKIEASISQSLGGGKHPWNQQMWGDAADRDTLVTAYEENHEVVYKHVERLLAELDGRSIVTADHANLIGERGFPVPIRMYGHPPDFPHPSLISVPWIEQEGDRRDVVSEPPIQGDRLSEEVVENRLESLGYR